MIPGEYISNQTFFKESNEFVLKLEQDFEESNTLALSTHASKDEDVQKPLRADYKSVRIDVVYKGVIRSMRRYYYNKILVSNAEYSSAFGMKQEEICVALLEEYIKEKFPHLIRDQTSFPKLVIYFGLIVKPGYFKEARR